MAAKLPDVNATISKNRSISIKQPIAAYNDFRDFVEQNSLAVNPATIIMFSMFHSAAIDYGVAVDIKKGKYKGTDIVMTTKTANGEVNTKIGDPYDPNSTDPEYTSDIHNLIRDELQKASLHIMELCAAQQVGSLRERNVTSYFKMARADIPVVRIMQIIEWIASVIPPIVKEADFQEHIKEVNWLKYHTAAASTQQLCDKFLSETRDAITWKQETEDKIRAAVEAPWDKALIDEIPTIVVQHTWCYLKAAKQLPDDWYQGNRAIAAMSAAAKARAMAFYTKLIDTKAKVADIEGKNTVDELKVVMNLEL